MQPLAARRQFELMNNLIVPDDRAGNQLWKKAT